MAIKTTLQARQAGQGLAELIRVREPVTIVIFGASGDLSHRKLLPALLRLYEAGYLPERCAIVGCARTPMTDEEFRAQLLKRLADSPQAAVGPAHPLVQSLFYEAGQAAAPDFGPRLKARLEQIERRRSLPGNRLFYLALTPELFVPILENLAASGLLHSPHDLNWSRVIIEKPYGRDLASARELNARVGAVLPESQVYRIDHFLGKETVQNILAFRFGNAIFEPLFNQKYVHDVQITVAETQGIEGRRGTYYDSAGALRDIVQNHMLQLLCLLAMEPPAALDAQAIRDEKVKVLRALAPFGCATAGECAVRGQYGVGERDGERIAPYREERGVREDSLTETYVALRLAIDNWRWSGVPFLLRTGKRLRKRLTEIAVQFKEPPRQLFRELAGGLSGQAWGNQLVFRIQPEEAIMLSFACKSPGLRLELDRVRMDFQYERTFRQRLPEAYERLLLDALRGDASLFTRSDEVEYAWRCADSILAGWSAAPPPQFPNYVPFSDGPPEADELPAAVGARWRELDDKG